MKGLLGKKIGMTTLFDEIGNKIPVTMIKAGPCFIIRKKTNEKDGYDALVLGFYEAREKVLTKPEKGILEKAKAPYLKYLKEFHFDSDKDMNIGDEIKVDIFSEGEIVKVSGKSKGKGFQGVMRKHGFHGGQRTHGQSDRLRAPGSIGGASDPSKVWKGMKMPGRMGFQRITVKNLEVIKVLKDKDLIMVKGAVPGRKNTLLEIRG